MKFATHSLRHIFVLLLLASLAIPVAVFASVPDASGIMTQNITFVENKGQVNDESGNPASDVFFVARSAGMTVYFTSNSIVYVASAINSKASGSKSPNDAIPLNAGVAGISRIDMHLAGSRHECIPQGLEPFGGSFNYYSGTSREINNIKGFKKIIYKDIYDNIDLVFYNSVSGKGLKYDFVVRPGGNIGDIKLLYKGGSPVVKKTGDLLVKNSIASVMESIPYAYQEIKNKSVMQSGSISEVKCRFATGSGIVSFSAGNYDKSQTLVIDPQVLWSTYYGGLFADHATAITVDNESNVIVSGMTLSDDLPATPGVFQPKTS